ncbi:MAG: extracellular solute-binding protein [Ruminococcaceae bacterium]|nr:extracellular solute-binding protein [Oscillospiraceae bacterium]
MKMSKILAVVLAAIMLVACFAACDQGGKGDNDGNTDLAGTYDIVMWVSEKDGVADQFKQQIAAFEKANPGIKINASIEGVTEADAGSKVVADVATAPDIYCFAQDQLARLVQAGALAKPGVKAAETIKANNDAGSVAAATVAGSIYAYPMTSDNGYFLYYDKSIISEEDADSLEAIIAACEKNGKKFRYALENAWYTASFFFATGCHSTWTMNESGEFIGIDDDFNSAAGLIAMKGMQKLAKSPCYDSNADEFTDAGAIVTGIWNAGAAEAHFGANLGATDLPSFEVDGKSYHLGGFTGYKLMGVKPQTDTKRAAVLSLLAQYLTGEECQLQRATEFQWGPSNIEAAKSEVVQSNLSLAAFAKQAASENCVPQGQIGGAWWDIAKVLGADAKNATSDADLQAALDNYDAAIGSWLEIPPEKRYAWTVIGTVGNTNWDTDYTMTEDPAGTWISVPIEMTQGEEFKVRQGLSWDNNYGADGVNNGANIVVEASGKYQVKLVISDTAVTIELVPAE